MGARHNENASQLDKLRQQYVTASIQSLTPNYIQSGKGAIVRDIDGEEWIDLSGGWGCLAVGYSHPKIVEAITDQVQNYTHTDFSSIPYPSFVKLAQRLSQLAPGPSPKKAAFFNSGAEAVENAVKIAKAHTGRNAVVVFENAFHGRTLLTMTMTHKASPYKNGYGPFASDVYRLPYPKDFPPEKLETKLKHLVDPSQVAAVVVEPIMGEGGFLVPPPHFLPFLRKLTEKYGIDLVFDEIQTGMGRTGKLFAAEHWDVEADLTTVAKSLAAGLPLSGVIGKSEIMDSPPANSIGGTYVGNPVGCEVALAVLDVIEQENLLQSADDIGEQAKRIFKSLRERYDVVGDVRGIGAMVAVELVKSKTSNEPAKKLTGKVIQEALRRKVILPTAGLNGNVIRLLAPLVIDSEVFQRGLDVVEESLGAALEE